MEVCVIAFASMKLLFPACPPRPVADAMQCTVQRISEHTRYHAICWDPKTKVIVYDHKVNEESSA